MRFWLHFGQCGWQERIFKDRNRELQPHCKSKDKGKKNNVIARQVGNQSKQGGDAKIESEKSGIPGMESFRQGNKHTHKNKLKKWHVTILNPKLLFFFSRMIFPIKHWLFILIIERWLCISYIPLIVAKLALKTRLIYRISKPKQVF